MKEAERKIAITSLVIVALCILAIIFMPKANAQSSQVRDHAKLQRENSFYVRMKSNSAFSMANAKYALKQAKKKRKETEKRERYYARVEAVRNKTLAEK